MAKISSIFIVFSFLLATSAHSKTIVVTNFDDTINQSNRLLGLKEFSHMSDLFKEMSLYADDIYVLTYKVSGYQKSIKKFLNRHGLGYLNLIMRNKRLNETRVEYKLSQIRELMDDGENDLILIGSDYDNDPEIYNEIQRMYGSRVLSVYIHSIDNRDLPEGQIKFLSALDVIYQEYDQRRVSYKTFLDFFNIVYDSKLEGFLPTYGYCPVDVEFWEDYRNPFLGTYLKKMGLKIIRFCRDREDKWF